MTVRLDETGFGTLRIYQQPDAFCYGVDAVLLADFAAAAVRKRGAACRVMDLGTGTGIIPLILCHKTEAAYLGGVELQASSFHLAEATAHYNDLEDRLHFFLGDVRIFGSAAPGAALAGTFDVVTANPPYMAGQCGIPGGDRAKALARHELAGSLEDFFALAALLLRDRGEFCLVHRPARLTDLLTLCRSCRLEPKELGLVSGKPDQPPNLVLLRAVKNGGAGLIVRPACAVHEADGAYSRQILRAYERI